jgi:hypothetical protein
VSMNPVDCDSGTVSLQFDNTSWYPRARRLLVSSTAYPRDPSAFHETVTVPFEGQAQVRIPLDSLAGRAVEVSEDDFGVLTTFAISDECPAGSGGAGSEPPAASGSSRLAATGADGILPVLALGSGLVVLGAGLVGAGRLRPRRFS